MRMNPGIILGIEPVNAMNALSQGAQTANAINTVRENNALAPFRRQQAELGVQQGQANLELTRERLTQIRQQSKMAAQEAARQGKAQQMAADLAREQGIVARAMAAYDQGGQEAADAIYMSDPETAEYRGQDPRIIGAGMIGMTEGLNEAQEFMKSGQPEGPEYGFNDGYFYDKNNPRAGAQRLPGLPQEEQARPLTPQERAEWGIPQDDNRPYAMTPDGPKLIGGSGQTINVNTGDQSGVTDKFYETLDKGQADLYQGLLNQGMTAPSRMAQVNELDRLLQQAPAGAEGAIKFTAGNFGINTEGLNDLQAAQAIISRLVPEQRPPGSGPMSDADLELFKQALPRLINTREGNKQIAATIRGIIAYELEQAEIARKVATREITPAEGYEELRNLSNPLLQYRRGDGPVTIDGYNIRKKSD